MTSERVFFCCWTTAVSPSNHVIHCLTLCLPKRSRFFYFPPQKPYPKHLQCFSLHLVHGNNISSSKKLFGLAVQDTEGWSEQSGYPFVTLSPTFRRQSSWLKKWWFTRDKRLSFHYNKYHLAVLWKGCGVNNPTSIIFFKRHGWLWPWLMFVL